VARSAGIFGGVRLGVRCCPKARDLGAECWEAFPRSKVLSEGVVGAERVRERLTGGPGWLTGDLVVPLIPPGGIFEVEVRDETCASVLQSDAQ
jgi:hypothetical protein